MDEFPRSSSCWFRLVMRIFVGRRLSVAAVVPLLFATALPAQEHAGKPVAVDFNRDIRPILSDKCFRCHGPDDSKREASLRLDSSDGLQADLGGYAAVVPGDLNESVLVSKITHSDPDQRMPPADSGRSLTQHEIDLISTWIQQGAVWQKHWSFIPPVRPELPKIEAENWPKNPIDWFVLDLSLIHI